MRLLIEIYTSNANSLDTSFLRLSSVLRWRVVARSAAWRPKNLAPLPKKLKGRVVASLIILLS